MSIGMTDGLEGCFEYLLLPFRYLINGNCNNQNRIGECELVSGFLDSMVFLHSNIFL